MTAQDPQQEEPPPSYVRTATEAQDVLAALGAAQQRAERTAQQAGNRNAVFTGVLGVVYGGLVVAVGLTEHSSPVGLILSIIAFAVVLQIVMAWRDRRRTALRAGWNRRFAVAMGATVLLYGAGVLAAAFDALGPRPAVWVPWGIVTGLPLLLAAAGDLRAR